ncbi:hypothetical protein MACH18_01320 [Phaeobacter italicus]|nr:hypothetical protein MACH18_01320 [Phaeobacter italicus]
MDRLKISSKNCRIAIERLLQGMTGATAGQQFPDKFTHSGSPAAQAAMLERAQGMGQPSGAARERSHTRSIAHTATRGLT